MAGLDLVDNRERAFQYESYVLEPFGILERGHVKLLAIGCAQTVAHRVNVFDVEKD